MSKDKEAVYTLGSCDPRTFSNHCMALERGIFTMGSSDPRSFNGLCASNLHWYMGNPESGDQKRVDTITKFEVDHVDGGLEIECACFVQSNLYAFAALLKEGYNQLIGVYVDEFGNEAKMNFIDIGDISLLEYKDGVEQACATERFAVSYAEFRPPRWVKQVLPKKETVNV